MKLACLLLPGKPITLMEDPNVIAGRTKTYRREDLTEILKHHTNSGPFNAAEKEIRESFDSLLNFFYKLEYLLTIGLIKKKEVEYFRFYINLIFDKENQRVLDYVRKYRFPFKGRLDCRLSSEKIEQAKRELFGFKLHTLHFQFIVYKDKLSNV